MERKMGILIVVDKALNTKISKYIQEGIQSGDWPPITQKGIQKEELMRYKLDAVEVKLLA